MIAGFHWLIRWEWGWVFSIFTSTYWNSINFQEENPINFHLATADESVWYLAACVYSLSICVFVHVLVCVIYLHRHLADIHFFPYNANCFLSFHPLAWHVHYSLIDFNFITFHLCNLISFHHFKSSTFFVIVVFHFCFFVEIS